MRARCYLLESREVAGPLHKDGTNSSYARRSYGEGQVGTAAARVHGDGLRGQRPNRFIVSRRDHLNGSWTEKEI